MQFKAGKPGCAEGTRGGRSGEDRAAETLGRYRRRGSTQAQTAGQWSEVRLAGAKGEQEAGDGGARGQCRGGRREPRLGEEGGNLGPGRKARVRPLEKARREGRSQAKEGTGSQGRERRGGNREPGQERDQEERGIQLRSEEGTGSPRREL